VLDASAYVEPAERELGAALKAVTPLANAAFDRADYTEMLRLLAALRDPVDRFFTDVMVMAEDPKLRANRLALLFQLHGLMNRFADLSMLAVQP
jgi:glycyl-tRNA synthetase beta chain